MKSFFELTKSGIVIFVLLSAVGGYSLSFPHGESFQGSHLVFFLFSLYLVSSGSFIINQAQEWKQDAVMGRTKRRPIPMGKLLPWQAWLLGCLFIVVGSGLLFSLSPLSSFLAVLTVFLYNGLYTLWWKKRWNFGAVPGAIPGAMPAVIGYAVHSSEIFSPGCIYLFLIMFLWQMPHFWCLAIRYREDYRAGGFPVLASSLGVEKTLYHIGLYLFVYVGVALVSPWFFKTHILYVLLVVPLSLKLLWEFFKYFRQEGKGDWLKFFLWVNFSLLIFISVPVLDRWMEVTWVGR